MTTTVTPALVSSTYYPCATPVPTLTGTIPYGDASNAPALSASLYGLNTPEGASLEACCNACYFQLVNCVQAYFYFYEGCVVDRAVSGYEGTGDGVSTTCPSGQLDGLVYSKDNDPAFRSTGSIAGPCGVTYDNLG